MGMGMGWVAAVVVQVKWVAAAANAIKAAVAAKVAERWVAVALAVGRVRQVAHINFR